MILTPRFFKLPLPPGEKKWQTGLDKGCQWWCHSKRTMDLQSYDLGFKTNLWNQEKKMSNRFEKRMASSTNTVREQCTKIRGRG